ncbi:MAG: type III pantothenate kinase [Flavobacteriaceae bacterium]|nr:type III pantothenate kinase [Flavobacteriaceae bacterium]
MNYLIIDIGNTLAKIAVYKNGEELEFEKCKSEVLQEKSFEYIEKYNISKGILSNVGVLDETVLDNLKQKINLIVLDNDTPLPFINNYQSKNTLGVDRIAVMAAASVYKSPVLVIDMGTCITYDYLNENKEYSGGAISPGIQMRFDSLNNYTSRLPKIKFNPKYNISEGVNTVTSIEKGVLNGVIHEINGIIDDYTIINSAVKVIVTGGNSGFVSGKLKYEICICEKLAVLGLLEISNFN